MTVKEIKDELLKLQEIDYKEFEGNYEKFNEIRLKYDYLQMQLTGTHMILDVTSLENIILEEE